ncbi:hypothetical protein IDJ77_12175 [Mucilaginibacter sp. ZT4R22]|uniref:Uncharacterized protein n=1 Tax=Mucilaginibacter pankratovii TaxID=2772110 RepID=A0ABR7WSR6_9SPHI|nr:hypothetical protein [Mucilaginibacter pankratovii]MBD1364567.1 hypothetical protein [Mucilaginibacter pankratovii]
MLQNRVNPHGDIIKTSARGTWLGNRGQLHNSGKTILRPFKHKAWIICLLQFKGRHRQVMAPNLWTELFFLDEATAFAAGHRPCFECRREDAKRFKAAWLSGNPEYDFPANVLIGKIDEIIHRERISLHNSKITFEADINNLPDGTFIELAGEAYIIANNYIFKWSPAGYDEGLPYPENEQVRVLTPRSVVNAFRCGYWPQIAIATSV